MNEFQYIILETNYCLWNLKRLKYIWFLYYFEYRELQRRLNNIEERARIYFKNK